MSPPPPHCHPRCRTDNVRADVWNLQSAGLITSASQSQIDRLQREIAGLNQDDARQARKEADLLGKLNRAQEGAAHTKSVSTAGMKFREAERAANDLASPS